MRDASYERSVWDKAYKHSELLLPEGPFSSQSSSQLEALLVRATKVSRAWTSSRPPILTRRRFPRALPTYNFAADVISGRFLQLAEENGIAWYDLDSSNVRDPVLTYSCPAVNTISGYMTYQTNANGEGPGIVWVAFMALLPVLRMWVPRSLESYYLFSSWASSVVLKVAFDTKIGHSVHLHAEIAAENVTKIIMNFDWLLTIREFRSPNEPLNLVHIPSMTNVYVPLPVSHSLPYCILSHLCRSKNRFSPTSTISTILSALTCSS